MAGQSSAALCYDVRGLSVQFSLRISFPKQRQRGGETDQTRDLQAVTRHHSLDLAGLVWSGRLRTLAWRSTDAASIARVETELRRRRRYVNRAAWQRHHCADCGWITSACEASTHAPQLPFVRRETPAADSSQQHH